MGVFGNGAVLTLGSAIANLTGISGPNLSADTIDVTTHDSADGFREFIGGLKDGGEISLEGNFTDAAAANVLITLFSSGEVTSGATLTVPSTDTSGTAILTFDGIVTGYEIDAPHDDKITFSATIKVTGKPVLTEGA